MYNLVFLSIMIDSKCLIWLLESLREESRSWNAKQILSQTKYDCDKQPTLPYSKTEKNNFSTCNSNASEHLSVENDHNALQYHVAGASCRYAPSYSNYDPGFSRATNSRYVVNERTSACVYNYKKSYLTST